MENLFINVSNFVRLLLMWKRDEGHKKMSFCIDLSTLAATEPHNHTAIHAIVVVHLAFVSTYHSMRICEEKK